MADMNEEYVVLRCPQCGGEVKVLPAVFDQHYMEIDGVAVYLGTLTNGEGAQCIQCGTRFERKQKIDITFRGEGSLHVDTGGGAFIGGGVRVQGGDFVGRDKVEVRVTGDRSVGIAGHVTGSTIIVGDGNKVKPCPKCGASVANARFCPNCGARV